MPITVTKEGGRTKIRGSETYPNGMTMTFHGPEEVRHMGGGKGLGRVGLTTRGKDSQGRTVEYSLGIGLGRNGTKGVNRLSDNYDQHRQRAARLR